jgi:hypothetical protein
VNLEYKGAVFDRKSLLKCNENMRLLNLSSKLSAPLASFKPEEMSTKSILSKDSFCLESRDLDEKHNIFSKKNVDEKK